MPTYTKKLITFFSSPEFIRFFVVGVTAFFVDFGLLTFQIYILHFNPFVGIVSVANVISVTAALVYGFILQRIWTFKSTDKSALHQGGKFFAVSVFSLVLNSLFYGLFISLFIIPPIAKVMVTGLQMGWNYFLYKYFVFKK